MYYCYILYSLKSGIFYIDHTDDLEREVVLHNRAKILSTGPHLPWELVWQEGFDTEKKAHDCARYLKSHNGREFAYKRLISMIFSQNESLPGLRRGIYS